MHDATIQHATVIFRRMLWAAGNRLQKHIYEKCSCRRNIPIVRDFLLDASAHTSWPPSISLTAFEAECATGDASIARYSVEGRMCKLCTYEIQSQRGVAHRLVHETLNQVQGMCLGCIKDRVDGTGRGEGLHSSQCNVSNATE